MAIKFFMSVNTKFRFQNIGQIPSCCVDDDDVFLWSILSSSRLTSKIIYRSTIDRNVCMLPSNLAMTRSTPVGLYTVRSVDLSVFMPSIKDLLYFRIFSCVVFFCYIQAVICWASAKDFLMPFHDQGMQNCWHEDAFFPVSQDWDPHCHNVVFGRLGLRFGICIPLRIPANEVVLSTFFNWF